ncbi:MAG: hypothetical protein JO189_14425 [Deltaproteobacteria bacterium]|nr:hypothetical protein [Deltaproteobacteria bacterium]
MRFIAVAAGVLILTAGGAPLAPSMGYNVIAVAAAAGTSGGQGISGHPQKNATINGPPKANPSISGSQTRRKH